MDTTTMRVLVVEPGKRPMVKEIETGLEPLQAAVGGLIEAVYPFEEPEVLVQQWEQMEYLQNKEKKAAYHLFNHLPL